MVLFDSGVWNGRQIYLDLQEMKDHNPLDGVFRFPLVPLVLEVILNNWWSYSDSDPFSLYHSLCEGWYLSF